MTVAEILKKEFPESFISEHHDYGDETVFIQKSNIVTVMRFLKYNARTSFEQLLDLCGVDYQGETPRFEVVYHLYSLSKKKRLRIRVKVDETDLKINTIIPVWEIADWFEREAWDMYGIYFEGHPNLKRLLTWEGFVGHPLRKDYPVNKRQPIPEPLDIV